MIPIRATQTRATCPYCGTGCGVLIESVKGKIINVQGDPEHPANFGRLCTKGSTLHLTAATSVQQQTRLLTPMRRSTRGTAPTAVAWDDAMNEAADRFAAIIREHGPEAVGFYGSGQLLTEDYYVMNKLVKGLIGTNNVDTNSRLCMSSAVAGYKATLGSDAPPSCYDDFQHAQTIFIVGANTAYAHPILFRRIEDAKRANPAMRMIVADPRKTETAEMADLFLPILPGTDVALFHGMLHIMLNEGLVDMGYVERHTQGFEALQVIVRDFTPEAVASACGISQDDLIKAARWFGDSTATLSLYCQGLNQSSSGTDKNAALINLHLATGQIGKAGAGPFSLTGQPNAMGGREVGGMANLLSAHRDLGNADHRAEVADLWGVRDVPAKPGKTAVEMFEAAARGEIKALWIACTNPAQSLPDQATVRKALEKAEFVVVQEAFATTATCAYADLLLPATTWGEKDGTVTNSERRISRIRAAIPAAGESRHDWAIFSDLGRRLEERLPERSGAYRRDVTTLFPYDTPESIWNEHRELTRGRDLDITGLSYQILETTGPQQWPMPDGQATGKVRLYEDGIYPTPTGRASFSAIRYEPVAEARDARFQYSLNTGRLRDQWHGMSRTGTLGRLFGHVSEPLIDMNPQDMARLGLADGDLVQVTSRRGTAVIPAQGSDAIAAMQAFIAMHWGEEYLSGIDAEGRPMTGVNALTVSTFCPKSKQPELKHAAVKISKAQYPWRLLAVAWMPQDQALAVREALKPLMSAFAFTSCVPFGREGQADGGSGKVGVLFRAAALEAASDALVERIELLLGIGGGDVLRYQDRKRGQRRAMRMARTDDGLKLQAFVLAGDISAEAWIRPLLQDELAADAYGRALLSPGSTPPVAVQSKGRQVCTCFNVTEPSIVEALATCPGNTDERLASLQGQLKCGTNCGSCIPELRKLIKLHPLPVTTPS
ncbi:nitrate reductase [Aquabacterium sp.]|uniref:nitrate reductase n=1 Tax=Aquabacterium sp. TaxID=1872578 RepID=UPI0024882E7E|nr:nitrate reductase [Aquabacterium sp.]MDI1258861.1 molybdopterin-dependent oxidoreductase [Aquabacterium sp.]